MSPATDNDTSALERARERLYDPNNEPARPGLAPASTDRGAVSHVWTDDTSLPFGKRFGDRHVRYAGIFFMAAVSFFLLSLVVVGYFFFFGGNSVSVDKVTLDIQGPSSIAGGDTVPLTLTIENKNPVALDAALLQIDFPSGTRSANNLREAYPRYTEKLGRIESGASITRSVKAVIFGGTGQILTLPVSLSYGTGGSNATFVKKTSYALAVSSAPLSVSVDSLVETVSGKPFSLTLTVRSNATIPLNNVVVSGALPFGFTLTSSSVPRNTTDFYLGTLGPGASKEIVLTGVLVGQDKEQRVFHFTVGTANSATDQSLAVSYMTQDSAVTIVAPFISAVLSLNGDSSASGVVSPGSHQNATVSYTNTLATSVTSATIAVTLTGSAVDYASVQANGGFYRSADHTILFNRDTDSTLTSLSPGATGLGAFSFSILPASALPPSSSVTFSIAVSGSRIGQTNVLEEVSATATKTIKVATQVGLSVASFHSAGPLSNSGPIPPAADQATTYTIVWHVQNAGNALADAVMRATLPSYVNYTGVTAGTFSYDTTTRTVTWRVGDLAQGGSAEAAFQVSLTPSTSQRGSSPQLTSTAALTGYDRYAGVQIAASAEPATTETRGDPGYSLEKAIVQ